MTTFHILDARAAETMLRRARKRLANATRAAAEEKSERIMRRRARRMGKAQAFEREALDFWAELDAIDAGD